MSDTTTIQVKRMPAALWRSVQVVAAQEGRTIRDVVIDALKVYIGKVQP